MKYAIIAAGEGSRLQKEGIDVPKPLVKIGGESLNDRLVRIFSSNGATEIVVITREPISITGNVRQVIKATPSSMHSFFEISSFLEGDEPFILTTVDTIFREDEFTDYVRTFEASMCDGMMGVTDYIDDEKPLYVAGYPVITGFLDADPDHVCHYISGGIYGLTAKSLHTLRRCMAEGQSRMRNFQRGLIADGLDIRAYKFSKVLDIDHASDIQKAEQFLCE